MGFDDTPASESPPFSSLAVGRVVLWVVRTLRPADGWIALLALVALAALPAFALDLNRWTRLPTTLNDLALAGALAVITAWWFAGWSRTVRVARWRTAAAAVTALAVMAAGLLVVSLYTAGWLPGPRLLWESLRAGSPAPALAEMDASLERTTARFAVWWVGARSGGAAQDEVIFAAFAGMAIWAAAAASALLARATRSGLASAAPLLALVGAIAFFGGEGRLLFLGALGAAFVLHIALDNALLTERWERQGLDSSGEIQNERWLHAGSLAASALLLAGIAPSLSVDSLASFYARLVSPIDERIETVRKEVFPNIETEPRFFVAGAEVGLPNDFLLGSGPELDQTRILLLRTSDAPLYYDAGAPAPYLRAVTMIEYDGRGWLATEPAERLPVEPNERRPGATAGRRPLAQTVRLYVPSRALFAAGEPVEASIAHWRELDNQGEIIRLTGASGIYAVVSLVPALGQEALSALPAWGGDNALPPGFESYLTLPPTVTERTRALADELSSGLDSPFAQASAIEDALRRFTYDLEVEPPPPGVDVADWFLFESQRGYCDYYATAFVVLARAVGLPARFAVGYAQGDWMVNEQAWSVTAADAHSWPEVYLPEVGWVPFEPTAARPLLERQGSAAEAGAAGPEAPVVAPEAAGGIDWNAQMLFWLIPLGLLVWLAATLILRWRAARADPWLTMTEWGARAGRPLQEGETTLEYAAALATLAAGLGARSPEAARAAAREAAALGHAVSAARYAPAAARPAALAEIAERWGRLRPLLRRLPRRAPRAAAPD